MNTNLSNAPTFKVKRDSPYTTYSHRFAVLKFCDRGQLGASAGKIVKVDFSLVKIWPMSHSKSCVAYVPLFLLRGLCANLNF